MNTNQNVRVGYIDYFDADKQFGFAHAGGERIFFHTSRCREVIGTPEDPILTDQLNDHQPTWWKRQRNPERVVLSVEQGPKGLRAARWGYLPKRTWLEELLRHDTLRTYENGRVYLRFSRDHGGRPTSKVQGRLTAAPELMAGEPWTLKLEYDTYESEAVVGEPYGHASVTYELVKHQAYPSKRLPYRRYAMDVYVEATNEWVHITFYPPEEFERELQARYTGD